MLHNASIIDNIDFFLNIQKTKTSPAIKSVTVHQKLTISSTILICFVLFL